LRRYPTDIYKIANPKVRTFDCNGLNGIGNVYRPYNPREPEYEDENVRAYVSSLGEVYDNYGVVPRNTTISRKALLRYNKVVEMDGKTEKFYITAGSYLTTEFSCMNNSVILDADTVISRLDHSKSPGWPWTLKYVNKHEYWNSEDARFFDLYFNSLSTENPIESFASNQVKEEIRLWEKIDDNNCRTIVSIDVNHLVAHCMYVMDQNEKLIDNCMNNNSSALGINLWGGGAHKLYSKMCAWGDIPCILSIDARQFDGSYHKLGFNLVYDARYKWLNVKYKLERNEDILKELSRQIYEANIVDIDGCVYERKNGGNISGQGSTTPDNILKNFIDVFCLFLLCMPVNFKNYENFKKYTRLALVGDDILLSVHPDIQEYFNQLTITNHSALIGMEYKFERQGFTRFINSTFIGHEFKYVCLPNGYYMYMPHIDCEKMRSSMLIFNDAKEERLENSMVRCAGLRNETFACVSCRKWFSDLWLFLLQKLDRNNKYYDRIVSNYKSDDDLWTMYSGIQYADLNVYKGTRSAYKLPNQL